MLTNYSGFTGQRWFPGGKKTKSKSCNRVMCGSLWLVIKML